MLPEERIRDELKSGALKPLPMREGGERFVELYLIFADPGQIRNDVNAMALEMRRATDA